MYSVASADHVDFVAAVGPNKPGSYGTRQTDDYRAEQGRPESGHLEIAQHDSNEAEHGRIQYECE